MDTLPRITGLALATIFGALGLLHVLWAAGLTWGAEATIPTEEVPPGAGGPGDGRPVIDPGPMACLVVAGLLFAAGLLSLARVGLLDWAGLHYGPTWIPKIGLWVIAVAFLLRAIGDFRYVGFFKKVRSTPFARMDTVLYSPLCLFLSALATLVSLTAS